jgi:protein O-mannosyl-transferase
MPPRADRRPSKPVTVPRASRHWVVVAAMCVAGIAAYGNSLSAPFVLDDQVSIVENLHIRQLWPPGSALTAEQDSPLAGRPIVSLSLALNYAVGGSDPRGYHVANIAIHLFAALLVFGIVRRTFDLLIARGRARGPAVLIAAFAAAVWLVHPLNTEAVSYVTQRTELLMGLCVFLTLYASLRAHQDHPSMWLPLAVASCAVGMGCKESMVTCPVLVLLFDRAFVYDSYREMFRALWRWYVALAATWSVLLLLNWSGPRMHSAGFSAGVSPWIYLMNQCVMIARYLQLTFWPRDLVFIYGVPQPLALGDVWPSALFVTALAVAAVVLWLRRPALGFLAMWVFITLSPTSSIVPS